MREDLIAELRELCAIEGRPLTVGERARTKIAMSEAADDLEAAREDAWIACSDILPERDGLGAVLAFDAARPRKGVWLETTHPSWWGRFMEDANEWGPTVTHWRPLPTPPAIDQARGKAGLGGGDGP